MKSAIPGLLAKAVAFVVATLLAGLLYAWVAPYSSEFGIFLIEIPLLFFFLFFLSLAVVLAALAPGPRRVVPALSWWAVLVGAWAGVALAAYLYPPDARRLAPPRAVKAAAQALCRDLVDAPPWASRIGPSAAASCEPRLTSSAKGAFGWRAPDAWPISLLFRYRTGSRASLKVWWAEDAGLRIDHLTLTYPRTSPPDWAGQDLAVWQPPRWPWQWAVQGPAPAPAVERQRKCDVRPCLPEAAAYWQFKVRWTDGRAIIWMARELGVGGSWEESLYFQGHWRPLLTAK